jgi:hypothetical protein
MRCTISTDFSQVGGILHQEYIKKCKFIEVYNRELQFAQSQCVVQQTDHYILFKQRLMY